MPDATHTAENGAHTHDWERRQNVTSKGYALPPYERCACGAARGLVEPMPNAENGARHCPTCTCGCTCGYGGLHEPENPRCELNTRVIPHASSDPSDPA